MRTLTLTPARGVGGGREDADGLVVADAPHPRRRVRDRDVRQRVGEPLRSPGAEGSAGDGTMLRPTTPPTTRASTAARASTPPRPPTSHLRSTVRQPERRVRPEPDSLLSVQRSQGLRPLPDRRPSRRDAGGGAGASRRATAAARRLRRRRRLRGAASIFLPDASRVRAPGVWPARTGCEPGSLPMTGAFGMFLVGSRRSGGAGYSFATSVVEYCGSRTAAPLACAAPIGAPRPRLARMPTPRV